MDFGSFKIAAVRQTVKTDIDIHIHERTSFILNE